MQTALATATGPHLFWITSRAAGIVALILSSLSVCIGLLMGGRLRGRSSELRVVHEALSLAVLGALVVHGVSLLGDSFLHPSLADIAVPFASSYETLWTSAGIIAFWALALLGLSYYLRARIGVQRWRRLHRLTALAWVLGLVHSLGEGTDAGETWFLVMTGIAVVPALVLLTLRWARRARERLRRDSAQPGRATAQPLAPSTPPDRDRAAMRSGAPDNRKLDARELARAKRAGMARRARRIRRSVAAGAASLFVAAFLIVYVQLASGHDPALAASATRKATVSKPASASAGGAPAKRTTEREAARLKAQEEAIRAREREAASSETSGEASSSESSSVEEPSGSEETSGSSSESGESSSSSGESESSGPSSLRTSQS